MYLHVDVQMLLSCARMSKEQASCRGRQANLPSRSISSLPDPKESTSAITGDTCIAAYVTTPVSAQRSINTNVCICCGPRTWAGMMIMASIVRWWQCMWQVCDRKRQRQIGYPCPPECSEDLPMEHHNQLLIAMRDCMSF